MRVYKGNILTVNKTDDIAKYLVEDKGRIVYIGDVLPDYEPVHRESEVADLVP